ncbi:MAG: DNA helicase RecG, partial [Candidatus Portnoybacteria bacterium CG_4_10_14_0_2_um_filter_43_36]
MDFSTPVEKIPRVGPAFLKKLHRLGIKTAGQLLYHFPHRYEDFSNLIPISQVKIGGPFCFQGQITDIKNIRTFRKRMMLTQAALQDPTGKLKVMWFNQPYLANTLKKGTFVCLAGKISGKGKSIYLSNPAYEKLPDNFREIDFELSHTGRLIPVYPETEGLSSKWLRFIVKPLLLKLKDRIPDFLPPKISKKYDFLAFQEAIWQIHFPDSLELAEKAKKRFGFEELFELSLFVQRERLKLAKEKALAISIDVDLMKEFTKSLPYELTNAQKKSSWQILKDLEKPRPMNRLLEGDVGSGKTVVAAMAALNVAKAGYQSAFLAPTEILAKQHFKTINEVLKKFKLNVGLITGKESYSGSKKITRRELLEKVTNKKVDILIGTHAIIQDTTPKTSEKTPIQFNNLALVIIDEQHRFGVEQRAKLCRQKSFIPHLLSMTATPIPRTLSLTVYGDLDLSIIDEMPKGRKKIITKIIQSKDKKATYEFIRRQVKEGRQAFVICPRIEPAKTSAEDLGGQTLVLDARNFSWMDVKAVKQEYKKLSEEIFSDLKVEMLHGKMGSQEKEKTM